MDGYAKMGRLMGEYPEVAIFRRFGALNMENLLLLQAELQDLEIRLRELQKADLESGHVDRTNYSRDWYTLKESGDSVAEPGNDGQQWALMLEIRDKLKEYSECHTVRIL
jgi:DNA-binding HxlR family transcriptional regulator